MPTYVEKRNAELDAYLLAHGATSTLVDIRAKFVVSNKRIYSRVKALKVKLLDGRAKGRRRVVKDDELPLTEQIVDLFRSEPDITITQIANAVDCSTATVSRVIQAYVREVASNPCDPLFIASELRRCEADLLHLKDSIAKGVNTAYLLQAVTEVTAEITTLITSMEAPNAAAQDRRQPQGEPEVHRTDRHVSEQRATAFA